MNQNKTSGPDSMKPVVLKNLCNEIAPLLAVIFQKSLNTGQVPKDWNKACVSPIFKKGNKSDPINYRPISLTCILQMMEHIVASSLSKHLDSNKILYDRKNFRFPLWEWRVWKKKYKHSWKSPSEATKEKIKAMFWYKHYERAVINFSVC